MGGIIVFARKQVATNEVIYSLDKGVSFSRFQFSNQPCLVQNIITVANHRHTVFALKAKDSQKGKQITVILNFDELMTSNCKIGSSLEYRELPPKGACNLGEKVITWRKLNKNCLIDPQVQDSATTRPCVCKLSDYYCQFGEQAVRNGDCLNVRTGKLSKPTLRDHNRCIEVRSRLVNIMWLAGIICLSLVAYKVFKIRSRPSELKIN